ncbi:class I SAM-dependent methyltransferase [Bartonella sp. DGB2]|uniref:class I SAM-dependent methyltransferase n=1 Tax=Bartonella sp. DGB2 TaxID=3388426 RepID=UPI00398FF6AD
MPIFLPFETNRLAPPSSDALWLTHGLEDLPIKEWAQYCHHITPWRGNFLCFAAAGLRCFPSLPDKGALYAGAILQLGKSVAYNKNRFLDLLARLSAGGFMVVAGGNRTGVKSFLMWAQKIAPLLGRESKNHGQVFWLERPAIVDFRMLATLYDPPCYFGDGFVTQAGMFSHGKVDKGSELLLPFIDKVAFGRVADLGAGWGYLSHAILRAPQLKVLDLYEADYEALGAAEQRLAATIRPVHFYWHDVVVEEIITVYDTVVMNPPFHTGQRRDIGLGKYFIDVAAKVLKRGGRLLMVANRQLPYEALLNERFRQVYCHQQGHGFKVLEAHR